MVLDLWCFEDSEEKDELISELINDGGACRTAPATPGLLKSLVITSLVQKWKICKVWG